MEESMADPQSERGVSREGAREGSDVARRGEPGSPSPRISDDDIREGVRRIGIGWVAAEISRHRGLAVCSPIAPFAETRAQVRQMVEDAGGAFFLVHVATPLEECERRDRKGLYAKARRGEIPEFTGISAPYEAPEKPELVVRTAGATVDQSVAEVIAFLERSGYLDSLRADTRTWRTLPDYTQVVRLRLKKGEHQVTLPSAVGGSVVKVKVDQRYQVISLRAVGSQVFAGGLAATGHLLYLGHRRIAHIKGHPQQIASAERERGFLAAVREAGLDDEDISVEQGYFTFRSGLEAAERLLSAKRRPTAIFAIESLTEEIRTTPLRFPGTIA